MGFQTKQIHIELKSANVVQSLNKQAVNPGFNLVTSATVTEPGSSRLRISFDEVNLGTKSFIKIISLINFLLILKKN